MLFGTRQNQSTNQALVDTVFSFLGDNSYAGNGFCAYPLRTTLSAKVRRDGRIGLIMIQAASPYDGKVRHRCRLKPRHWSGLYPNLQDFWALRQARRVANYMYQNIDHTSETSKLAADLASKTVDLYKKSLAKDAEYELRRWWERD